MAASPGFLVFSSGEPGGHLWRLQRGDFRQRARLVRELVRAQVKMKYRGSVAGWIWSMMNPLLMVAVLSPIFSRVLGLELRSYVLFLLSAYLPWSFFLQGVMEAMESPISYGTVMRNYPVSKAVFPASAVLTQMIYLAQALVPFLLLLPVLGGRFSLPLLFLPVAWVFLFAFSCGSGMFLAALRVRYGDIPHLAQAILGIGFFATPILYDVANVGGGLRWLFFLNPMTHILGCFRAPLLSGELPSLWMIVVSGACALAVAGFGLAFFSLREQELVTSA